MVEQYQEEIAVIRYHTWWPSQNDPFYYYNIAENTARTVFYEIEWIPYLIVDGLLDGSYNRSIWDSLLVSRMDFDSPLEMTISGSYDYQDGEGNLDISVIATDEIAHDSLRLHCAITESGIYWPAPNGLEIHNQTMRDMVPDAEGEPLTIQYGDTLSFARQFVLYEPIVADSCEVVVFVQDNESKEILQAAKIQIIDLVETKIEDQSGEPPSVFEVFPAYPNPFNSSTTIAFSMPQAQFVRLTIYDLLGREVRTLLDEYRQAGIHHISFDASDLTSGIYFYRLQAGETAESRRMVLLK